MSVSQDHSQRLDQLQREINAVLEQIGRIFAAAHAGNNAAPLAQASKLKQILPSSVSRFHDALDQLEDELHFARTVLRRDLALCREKSGLQKPAAVAGAVARCNAEHALVAGTDSGPNNAAQSIPPQSPKALQELGNASEPATTTESNNDSLETTVNDQPNYVPSTEAHTKNVVALAPDESDAPHKKKAADQSLQIDTEPTDTTTQTDKKQRPDDDKAPDTGTVNNNADLDSLFNDPKSAGAGDTGDFSADTSSGNEFDFGSFNANFDADSTDNADTDNLSSLLPGLQDYANTRPTGSEEPDFSALFSTTAQAGGGQDGGGGDEHQSSGEHRGSGTFDDLMDFSFDITGGGEEGSNHDNDFSFSFT